MKALILAAGYGSRLGAITKNKPKPLLNVAGKPVIARLIENLHLHKITEIIVNLHYLPAEIHKFLGGNVLYYYEPKLLGHRGTILSLKNWLENDDFMVVNGDTLNDLNYTEMMTLYQAETIMVAMEEWRAIGTWIYSQKYFQNQNLPVVPYRPATINWFDIGTPGRLRAAKEFFET